MKSDTHTTDKASTLRAAVSAYEGYLTSSLDLRAGVSVREVLITALPHEVVHELARMKRSWPSARASLQAN